MCSGNSPSHPGNFYMSKHPAWFSILFLFLMGFVFQGCVIHTDHSGHRRHSSAGTISAPITFAFTDHHRRTAHNYYHDHYRHHGKKHTWKKRWRHKKNSHLHSRIQTQVVPFDLIRQFPHPPRGTRYIYVDDQVLLINVKTRRVLDFINISVSKPAPRTVDRMPSHEEQHPSQTHQPPPHARAYEVAQGKPFMEKHPSSHGQGNNRNRGKPDMSGEHPSFQGQSKGMSRGKPDMGDHHPSQQAKNDRGHGQQADRGEPLWKNKPSSDHAKRNKGNRGGLQQGDHDPQGGRIGRPQKDRNRPGKSKPSMDSPMADDSGSHQIATKGISDRREPQGRGKQKDTFADSSSQEDSSVQPSSHSKNKGKPFKHDYDSARGPSGQEEIEQFQHKPEENIQVAKIKRGRGKDNSKGASKTNKMKRGKHEQQTDTTEVVTQQEPTTNRVTPKLITSIAPSSFDSSQRSIIQNYYQNSGSKKSGKGRGKNPRGPKRNKTSSVSKNDILTQPTEPLPRRLESQLPPTPPNTKRVLYNQQVLLIGNTTHRVLDVIKVNN